MADLEIRYYAYSPEPADTAHVGVVSPFKFSQFLRGFGPLKVCIERVNKITSERWFYGCLSRREALLLLAGQPVGTFLMRFSKSQPGAFALSFVSEQKQVVRYASAYTR